MIRPRASREEVPPLLLNNEIWFIMRAVRLMIQCLLLQNGMVLSEDRVRNTDRLSSLHFQAKELQDQIWSPDGLFILQLYYQLSYVSWLA